MWEIGVLSWRGIQVSFRGFDIFLGGLKRWTGGKLDEAQVLNFVQ